ncbi:hypothetical protein Lalb_Chr16g0390631 [Lupinus albus]|uniref:Uncharacterized protein n=1 Tax=Lupinus albus TaxID=3870 RepID=A0A6A4PDS4_LUPAL|nr:hypothetical protein Lalb_Chr16g0390631 [Lupinus albus]
MLILMYDFDFVVARTKRGTFELDLYLCKKHNEVLANTLEPGSYRKTCSLAIVDGFGVEITKDQVIYIILFFVSYYSYMFCGIIICS